MQRTMLAALLAFVAFALVWAALAMLGAARWNATTRRLHARLEDGRRVPVPSRVDFRELAALPAPVQRYFRAVLADGAPIVAAVAVTHSGTFDMGETAPQWKRFTSSQHVVTRAPGFVWSGVVRMLPAVPVRVHDAYVAGEGVLRAALLGVVPLAELADDDLAASELLRFFAEAAWYPTALLPSQGVQWQAIDDRSARATLSDGRVRVAMTFRFGADGLIASVRAAARGRAVAGKMVPTPWQGRWSNYAERDGMRVPLSGEVGWLLPGGDKPYWRATIESLRYELAAARD